MPEDPDQTWAWRRAQHGATPNGSGHRPDAERRAGDFADKKTTPDTGPGVVGFVLVS